MSACERLLFLLETPQNKGGLGSNAPAFAAPRSDVPSSIYDYALACSLLISSFSGTPKTTLLEPEDSPAENLSARRYTFAHTLRVHHYVQIICQETSTNDNDLLAASLAALNHDNGKTHNQLRKVHHYNSKANGEPYDKELMQTHVCHSIDFANSAGVKESAVEAIENHHERFDGTGYPKGISGATIPVTSIILSIADIFDSAVSKRPYNGHELNDMSFQDIVAELRTKLFANSKFSQDKLELFEAIVNRVDEKHAKQLYEFTTKLAEETITH